MKKLKFIFFPAFLLLLSGLAYAPSTQAATSTVCASGCDFVSLKDAITAFTPTDGILLDTGYVFDDTLEDDTISFPDQLTLACSPGVVFGDVDDTRGLLLPGSDMTIRDCTFEKVDFDATGRTNVSFLNNTFSNVASSGLVFTSTDGFVIRGNNGIQKVQVQNADNGTIEDNAFECRFNNNCLTLSTAGGGPFDFTNPNDVPANFLVANNTFSNYNTNSGGDFVHLFAGLNVDFVDNTVESAVLMNDAFVTMLTIQNGEVYLARNIFLFPEKSPGATNGAWGINIRVDEGDANVVAEHNTLIMGGAESTVGANSCFGIFDGGAASGLQVVNAEFRYNLCHNPLSTVGGNGVSMNYDPASSTVHFVDAYNGLSNLGGAIGDSSNLLTSLSPTTKFGNPAFKVEDADSDNDLQLAPFSNFLDVDGTKDIGAFEGVRGSVFHVLAGGSVNYSSIDTTSTEPIAANLRNNDTVYFGNGTYPPLLLRRSAHLDSQLTVIGAGNGTIFEVPSNQVGSPVVLDGISESTLSHLVAQGASSTFSVPTYTITRSLFDFAGSTYDQTTPIVGSPNLALLVEDAGTCNISFITSDEHDVTATVGSAVDNWNVGLIDVFGNKITVYTPNNFISSGGDLATYLANFCGATATVDVFIQNVFQVSGGSYTYNASAVALAGASIRSGDTDPARITRSVISDERGGFMLIGAEDNVLTSVTSTANTNGLLFSATSTGNYIKNSALLGNELSDIYSSSTSNNHLVNTFFDRLSSRILGSGDVHVYFDVRAFVQDSGSNPLSGISVIFESADGSTSTTMVTGVDGYTPYAPVLPGYNLTVVSLAETTGGLNPYSIAVEASEEYQAMSIIGNINTRYQTFSLTLTAAPSVVSPSQNTGSGGLSIGGASAIPAPSLSSVSVTPIVSTVRVNAIPLPEIVTRLGFAMNDLVKLKDDGNPETEEDSAVYYVGADGRRHAFPNSEVYFSWYCDFSAVRIIPASILSQIPMGRNVVFQPGKLLVRFPSLVGIYMVKAGSLLRLISDETLPASFLGADWKVNIKNISEALFHDYIIDTVPATLADFQTMKRVPSTISGSMNLGSETPVFIDKPQCSDRTATTTSWPFLSVPKKFVFTTNLSVTSADAVDTRFLQEILRFLGPVIYPEARVTGIYGPATFEAVKRFQKANGLVMSGIVGPSTRAELNTLLDKYR